MRRFVLFSFVIGILTSTIVAQTSTKELNSELKVLKRSLLKHAVYVQSVEIDGCRLAIRHGRLSYGFGGVQSGSYAGGGFPNDEAARAFSVGPSQNISASNKLERYSIDFSKIEPANITSEFGNRKGISRILLLSDENSGAISIKREGKYTKTATLGLVSKTKSAVKLSESLKAVIELCSIPK